MGLQPPTQRPLLVEECHVEVGFSKELPTEIYSALAEHIARFSPAFEVTFDAEDDAIVFRRINREGDWLAVLEQCPVPMDDLPPRRREDFQPKL